jgi:pimeloyl-ACP methyl ester carboxylesterase
MADPATLVLVHGAWHGAWCWEQLTPFLRMPYVALDNPSVARADATLADDVANITRALDAIDGPVVLVGHSYGGAIASEAGAHDSVRHVVYITGFALDEGESVMQNALEGGVPGPLDHALQFDGDVVTLDRDGAIAAFYHDCGAAAAHDAVGRLRPQAVGALAGTVRAAAWRAKPSTYLVCTDDRALSPALQRSAAARVKNVVEIDASHSPFLSRPAEVADLLRQLAQ